MYLKFYQAKQLIFIKLKFKRSLIAEEDSL